MQGDCYVFDRRAALNHSLQSCRQWCFNCRRALSPAGSSRRTVRSRALSVVCCVWLRALTVPAVHWSPGSVRDDVSAVRGGCFVRALLRFAHGGAAGQLPNSPTAVRDAAAEFPHGVWRASVLVSLHRASAGRHKTARSRAPRRVVFYPRRVWMLNAHRRLQFRHASAQTLVDPTTGYATGKTDAPYIVCTGSDQRSFKLAAGYACAAGPVRERAWPFGTRSF